MDILEDFCDLIKDIGSDTLKLGSDLLDITCDGIREFADDPVAYTVESVEEIAGLAGALVMMDCCSRRVKPVAGSVVYYRMFNGLAEHSGVYVGDGMIVHLDGFGFVTKVSMDAFVYCMNAWVQVMMFTCRHVLAKQSGWQRPLNAPRRRSGHFGTTM